jgi:hypothetical protein
MLSYAPLDDDDRETQPLVLKKQPPLPPTSGVGKQECECMYLVMFFVFGAVILSMT